MLSPYYIARSGVASLQGHGFPRQRYGDVAGASVAFAASLIGRQTEG